MVGIWRIAAGRSGDDRAGRGQRVGISTGAAAALVPGPRFGSDPAYGSGPLATIVQDVLSLLIYFASVSWIVL